MREGRANSAKHVRADILFKQVLNFDPNQPRTLRTNLDTKLTVHSPGIRGVVGIEVPGILPACECLMIIHIS